MKTVNVAATLVIVALIIAALVIAQNLIVPLLIAIFVWYLINTIASAIHKPRIGGNRIPRIAAMLFSTCLILAAVFLGSEIIVQTVQEMMESADDYQERLSTVKETLRQFLKLDSFPSFSQIIENFDLKSIVGEVGTHVSAAASNIFLVVLYVLFLLLEQSSFPHKLRLMTGDHDRFVQFRETMGHINESMKAYISIKTAISFLTGLLSFLIMYAVGLDFAVFWAFLIFALNFIPNIGSFLGAVFPSLFALIQFNSFTPFLVLAFGIFVVDAVMGNIVEPKVMGNRLNISSTVVLVSLTFWGMIWGVIGMVFSVPITVAIILVCAEFPATRNFAILLSATGDVSQARNEKDQDE